MNLSDKSKIKKQNFDSIEYVFKLLEELESFDESPVDIETFIKDDYFLGSYFGGNFNTYWLGVLKEIFPNPYISPYYLINFGGAIGRGKSTTTLTGMSYDLYKLLCLKNPQKYLGVLDYTKIIFLIFNVTLSLASGVLWAQLNNMISGSPFFQKWLNPARKMDKSKSLFLKNIDISVGSRLVHSLGKAVYGIVLSESNFPQITDQVEKSFISSLRRIQSRFLKDGKIAGKIWVDSSEGEKAYRINKLIEDYARTGGVYINKGPLWQVWVDRYKKQKKFYVFKGDGIREPFIITDEDKKFIMANRDLIIEVPEIHRKDFEIDIYSALRDLAGETITTSYKFFRTREKLLKAMNVVNIFRKDVIELDFFDDNDKIENYIKFTNYLKKPLNPNKPRYVHIDIGLTGDRLGFAMCYPVGFKEIETVNITTYEKVRDVMPVIVNEMAFAVKAKSGQQVPLFKIRLFLLYLIDCGFNIEKVTLDGFQSADMIQTLQKLNLDAGLLSVDRSIEPYATLRDAVYNETINFVKNDLLFEELKNVEVTEKIKIDHPRDGSKDIADALAGSFYVAKENSNNYKLLDYAETQAVIYNKQIYEDLAMYDTNGMGRNFYDD
jgi:hypothetical protein